MRLLVISSAARDSSGSSLAFDANEGGLQLCPRTGAEAALRSTV